ncbi:hypothetical protein DFJ74DRAFT_657226 [Hyaloraphidium curvatum]|nr:hypothetical protein DFJ74DRAFT_657226 [Hyaloraphidium curvatum]
MPMDSSSVRSPAVSSSSSRRSVLGKAASAAGSPVENSAGSERHQRSLPARPGNGERSTTPSANPRYIPQLSSAGAVSRSLMSAVDPDPSSPSSTMNSATVARDGGRRFPASMSKAPAPDASRVPIVRCCSAHKLGRRSKNGGTASSSVSEKPACWSSPSSMMTASDSSERHSRRTSPAPSRMGFSRIFFTSRSLRRVSAEAR